MGSVAIRNHKLKQQIEDLEQEFLSFQDNTESLEESVELLERTIKIHQAQLAEKDAQHQAQLAENDAQHQAQLAQQHAQHKAQLAQEHALQLEKDELVQAEVEMAAEAYEKLHDINHALVWQIVGLQKQNEARDEVQNAHQAAHLTSYIENFIVIFFPWILRCLILVAFLVIVAFLSLFASYIQTEQTRDDPVFYNHCFSPLALNTPVQCLDQYFQTLNISDFDITGRIIEMSNAF